MRANWVSNEPAEFTNFKTLRGMFQTLDSHMVVMESVRMCEFRINQIYICVRAEASTCELSCIIRIFGLGTILYINRQLLRATENHRARGFVRLSISIVSRWIG